MENITLGVYLTKIKTNRASVLPYTIRREIKNGKIQTKIYFLLAVDSKSKDFTDLGGGVKKTEYSLIAALREFKEESNEIFGEVYDQINNMSTNIAIISNQMSVLCIPLDEVWFDIAVKKFNDTHTNKKTHNEVSELIWIDQNSFFEILKGKKMWLRIRQFYRSNYTPELLEALEFIWKREFS